MLRRPLVTGAGGFIGLHMCSFLNSLSEVDEVIAVDIPDSKNLMRLRGLEKVTLVESPINYESIDDVLSLDPTAVFAFAALNGTARFYTEPFKVIEFSTIPTLALLSKLRKDCPVLYSSSSEVYASNMKLGIAEIPTPETIPISIDDIHNPRWSYAVAKIHGEMAVISSSIQDKRPTAIVRYHNVYGPHMGSDHFIPDFIERVLNGSFWVQNANATRSFLHISDAVRGTVSALLKADSSSPIFHLGNTEEITIKEAAIKITKQMGIINAKIEEHEGPAGSVQRRVPSIEKAIEILDWQPLVNFDEGIKDYLECSAFNRKLSSR